MSTVDLEVTTVSTAGPAAAARPAQEIADRTSLDATLLTLTDLLLLAGAMNLAGCSLLWSLPLCALYAAAGLYPGFGIVSHERLRYRWVIGGLYCLALAPFSGPAMLACAACLLLMPLAESFSRSVLHRLGLWGKPARLIGQSEALQQNWYLGLVPANSTDALVLARGAQLNPLQARYREIYLLDEGGLITRIKPPQTAFARWLGQSVVHNPNAAPYRQIKRLMDVVLSTLLLVASAFLTLLAMLAIYAIDPGPVIYTQQRRTQHGRPVRIYKLRSMYQDSDARLQQLLNSDADAAARWASHFKLKTDPRVLPFIGGFIRLFSIDELPQLINVLKGEMSLIGPRIFVDYDLEVYTPSLLQVRQSVLAGITGLWQVSVRSDGDNADKVRYDTAYVRSWSLWQDIDILYRTVGAVLTGRGAV